MKRFISIILTISMLLALFPATVVFAAEKSDVKVEYMTFHDGAARKNSGYSAGGDPKTDITYTSSKGRAEWLSFTTNSVSWNRGAIQIQAGGAGQYGAYKIRVPKKGVYTVTVQYRRRPSSAAAEMYILPISEKSNIANALATAKVQATVDFAGDDQAATDEFASVTPFDWEAPVEGEYIVVWKATKAGAMRPANLIFDGGTGKAPISAESSLAKATLNAAGRESTEITTTSVTMSDTSTGSAADIEALTYESSDENVVTVSGKTVTAVSEGKARIYTKSGNLIIAENEILVSNVEYSGVYATYPTFIGSGGFSNGELASPADIKYETSGGRLDRYYYNGTGFGTTNPGWNGNAARLFTKKGEIAAYKINVPAEGYYDVTLQYLTRQGSGIADMYILPGNIKGEELADELKNYKPVISGVDFYNTDNSNVALSSVAGSFAAESAGEYIMAWVCTDDRNGASIRPANLILDGGDDAAVSKVAFSLSNTLKPSITLYMSDGNKLDGSFAEITYTSSDESLLKIDNETGKFTGLGAGPVTVTAKVVYKNKIYTGTVSKTLTGEESLSYSGVAFKYNFNKRSADWDPPYWDENSQPFAKRYEDVRGIMYEYTDNNYAWFGTTNDVNQSAWCYAYDDIPQGRMRILMRKGDWTGFKIKIPQKGRYAVHVKYVKYYSGEGPSDIYLIPADTAYENVPSLLNEDTYIGTVDSNDPTATELKFGEIWLNDVDIRTPGEYALIFKTRTQTSWGIYTTIQSVTLDGVAGLKRVDFSAVDDAIDVGKSIDTSVAAYLLDGTKIANDELRIAYTSEAPHITTVSDDGKITGVSEGIANINAVVTYGSDSRTATIAVNVTDNTGVERAELVGSSDKLYVGGKVKLTALAYMNSGNKFIVDNGNVTYELLCDPDGAAIVEDGYITALAEGSISVSASVSFKGEVKITNGLSFVISPGSQKTGPTIYTYEMRENAIANAKKYDWAKQLAKTATTNADKYLDKLDTIYSMIEYDNLPRSYTTALVDDPDAYSCLYCGIDIRDSYGSYAWGVDPINRPWKIQCPDCKRLFPSNDFESFYEMGKDEYGRFDMARARQLHHEMLFHPDGEECTHTAPAEEYTEEWYEYYGYGNEKGYLYNTMYEDVSKDLGVPQEEACRWAVDDGRGYYTGEAASTGVPIKKAYIAFYNFALWSYGYPNRYITKAIDSFRDAYLYTGDIKYGRAGAILIDRVADVYPSYDWRQYNEYQQSHGGRNTGKIDGNIWEMNNAECFARAYDAFWPAMDDPQVTEYLSKKAEKLGLENKKLSAAMIRQNCEDGICREIYKAATEAKIWGNFGMHQLAVACAAVALDSMPETEEMIEWLCAPSTGTETTEVKYGKTFWVYTANSGGEMLPKFINETDRDGFGGEVSELYNQGWLTNTRKIAELFYKYEKSDKLNLYENPKFRKMFYAIFNMTMAGNYTVQIGDQYSTASVKNTTDRYNTLLALKRLDDRSFAQMYYAILNGDVEDAYIDMFEENAGELGNEISDYVSEHGEIKLPSRNLAGYGLATLRAGDKIKGAQMKDLRRDTWLWYGYSEAAHGHKDILQLGIDAYGFNFTPDLGYPAATSYDPNRLQWVSNTLSHNTVVVDGKKQLGIRVGEPLHFEDAGRVGVIDVEAPQVYDETDIYRRTLVTVEAAEGDAYTVDFFRVRGGNEHIYSFHTQSFNGVTVEGLNLTAQNGGTYAGEDTKYGNDPNTQNSNSYETKYPRGYTWLRNVRRDESPEDGSFSVNFKQTDFNKQVSDSKGLNLRWTALNDWTPSSVGFATAETPKLSHNKNIPELDYMLVHRKSDESLDTLFTSVIQPYKGSEYIESMASVALTVTDGTETDDDTAKAVKVKLKSGRCDYIVYATNNGVTYTLTDGNVSFNFRGFVGVYSVNKNGANIYSYVNDGDIIGDTATVASVSGKVVGFTKELANENSITVKLDSETDAATLAGRYIYIDNAGDRNGAYKIESATVSGKDAVLDIGDVTLIKQYRDSANLELGYLYNIAEGDGFIIPFSAAEDRAPIPGEIKDSLTTSAGSSISVTVGAESPIGETLTYIGTHLPRGVSLNSSTGVITWKPDASQVGEHGFLVTARDESGRESTISFDVTVYGSTTSGSSSDSTENSVTSGEGTASGGGGGGGETSGQETTDTNPEDSASDNSETDDKTDSGEQTDGETDDIRFTDLTNHAWAEKEINALADDGIVKGTTASTYSPANNITRADFALLLVRAFELESDDTENFADVSANDYFAPELAIARNSGIVNGIGDNKFAPRNHITRQDMMVIVYRALSSLPLEGKVPSAGEADEVLSQYLDFTTVAPYAKTAVSALIGAGLVNGKSGKIAPADYTTRAEVAVLIKRIMDYKK